MDYVPVYRQLVWNAMKASWHRRGLWVFAFFAGLIQTGAIANDVIDFAPDLKPGSISWATIEETANNFAFLKTYALTLMTGTPLQIFTSTLTAVGVAALLTLIVLLSQHVVVHGVYRVAKRKTHLTATQLRKHVQGIHVARLFGVNALSKILTLILILGGAVLIRKLLSAVPEAGILGPMAVYAIVLPAMFVVSAVSMKTIVHIVRDDAAILTALQKSVTFFARHWLASLEFAGILFLVNYVVSVLMLGLLLTLGSALVNIYSAANSSIGLMVATLGVTGISVIALIVAVGGFMTTTNYSAWTEFIERFSRAPVHPKTEHVAHLYRTLAR